MRLLEVTNPLAAGRTLEEVETSLHIPKWGHWLAGYGGPTDRVFDN
jgi:hypothetical protein